ncbi:MAG: Ig-like domain-containing protein [Chloroflexi bacterium]|nr:Ig-like domain-containing protein [Chloroflexota bacterium]
MRRQICLAFALINLLMLAGAVHISAQVTQIAYLEVIDVQPSPAGQLGLRDAVTLWFNRRVDCADAEAALSWQPAIRGELSCDEYSVSFEPGGAYQRDQRYAFSLNTPLRAKDGAPLLDPFQVVFSTVGFLTIADAFPQPGSSLAPADSAISVAFDAPVVPLALSPDLDDLPQPLSLSPVVAGLGEWVNSAVYVFRPSQPLDGDTEYTVTISADLAAVDGSVIAGAASWSFKTAPPTIVAIDPPPGTDDLILNPQIQIRFDQPLAQNLVERAFRFQAQPNSSDPKLGGAFKWAEDGLGFAFVPGRRLALDTVYQASFDGELLPGLRMAADSQAPSWRYTTVGAPSIIDTEPRDGERDAYTHGLSLYFASPMNIDSLDGKVRIEPAPDEAPITYYSDWNKRYALSFDAQPDTNYRVTVDAGMQDIYGNAIAEPLTVAYKTEPRPPEVGFVMPGAVAFYNAHQPPTQLQLYHRGIEQADLSLYRVSLENFVARLTNPEVYSPSADYEPSPSELLQSWQIDGGENQSRQTQMLTLSEAGLAPGLYFAELNAPGLDLRWAPNKQFLHVATAVLTIKQSADQLTIWAVDLGSGAPISGERIKVFGAESIEIGSGISDEQGIVQIDLPAAKGRYAGYAVVLDAGEHFGIGYSNWTDGAEPWEFGVHADFYPSDYQVLVYTDRPIYRPGQPVYFRGLVRAKDDVRYTPPQHASVQLTIRDSRGERIHETELPLSKVGSFHGEYALPADVAPGPFYISISLPVDDNWQEEADGVAFQVAEYRLPEYAVSLNAQPAQIVQGDTAEIELRGKYYFGGAVSFADAEYAVVSAPYAFQYSGDGDYDFGEYDPYAEPAMYGIDENMVSQGTLRTDALGTARFQLIGNLEAEAGSQRWLVEASVADESGQAIYEQTRLIVHQGLFYIGARPESAVVQAGEDSRIQLIAVDWDSQPVASQRIDIEVVERRWRRVQEQDPISGRVSTSWQVDEIPVSSGSLVTDAAGQAAFVYQPPVGGVYKITASSSDSVGNDVKTATTTWVAGDDYIPWRAQNDRVIELVPAQSDYRIGDTAKVLITSPWRGETLAWVTIERGDVLAAEVITLRSNSQLYEFEVLPEHAPNIFVSVFLMKPPDADNPSTSWRMGMTQLTVDTEQKALSIGIRPDRSVAAPQDIVSFQLQVQDYRGEGVEAEVGVSLSDLAALSLAERNSPPLLKQFYGLQGLGVQTSSPLVVNVAEARAVMESAAMPDMCCFGGGGGFSDEAIVDIRSEFIDTPYWNPLVLTDAQGEAIVEMRLPDNLTTWQLDARAWTNSPDGELLLGENTADLRSTRPLLIRPITPRFFIVGDRAQLAAIVNNNTDAAVAARVSIENLAGLRLAGESNAQPVHVPAGGRQRVTWLVEVEDVESVAPYFLVRSDDGAFSDASISPVSDDDEGSLPVYRYAVPETVGTAGMLREAGTTVEALRLPADLDLRDGSLDIRIDKSLAGVITESLSYVDHMALRHWDCTASVVSRLLPNIANFRALEKLDLADAVLKAKLDSLVAESLEELAARQQGTGGWSWCSGDDSDTMTTAYALYALAQAQLVGYPVDHSVISRAQGFLRSSLVLPSLSVTTWQLNRQAFILFALEQSGAPDRARSAALYESRQVLNTDAIAFLAQTLHGIDSSDTERLDALTQQILSRAVFRATGTFFEDSQVDRWTWSTDIRRTALALDTLLTLRPESELLPNIVRHLVRVREGKSHWGSLQESAWTILALTNWMLHSGELVPDFIYSAAVNDDQLLANAAVPDNALHADALQVDLAQLLPGETNLLAFQRGDGAGALYYTAHLNADLPVPAIAPLSRGIEVSRTYTLLGDETKTPIDNATVGETLQVRLQIVAPNTLRYVVIEDTFPAGAEAVDPALATSQQIGAMPGGEVIDQEVGWGWWHFDHIEFRDEKASIYASYLPRGVYEYVYTIRPSVAGEYQVIPPTAQEMNFPEVYGRGAGGLFVITD